MATAQRQSDVTNTEFGGKKVSAGDQLRRDRIRAIAVLVVFAVLMALLMWLASLGNGTVEPIDYWPVMP